MHGRLVDDLGARRARPLAVRVHVVDVHHHVLGVAAADRLRTAKTPALLDAHLLVADHHHTVAEHELGVLDPTALLDLESDLEPERVAQPVDRLGGVLVIEPGRDPGQPFGVGFMSLS